MEQNGFQSSANLQMLWEIVLDELQVSQYESPTIVRTIFDTNVNMFLVKSNLHQPLVSLNKQFLSQVIQAVYKLIPDWKQRKKIQILDELKIEDTHQARMNEMEIQMKAKQMEMEQWLTPAKPVEPQFADTMDVNGTPIDQLLAHKLAERDLPLPLPAPKKVTWASDSVDTLMSKLKKTSSLPSPSAPSSSPYEEQQSKSLDSFMEKEKTNKPEEDENKDISVVVPSVLPITEIVKMLNEMNSKLDRLIAKMEN